MPGNKLRGTFIQVVSFSLTARGDDEDENQAALKGKFLWKKTKTKTTFSGKADKDEPNLILEEDFDEDSPEGPPQGMKRIYSADLEEQKKGGKKLVGNFVVARKKDQKDALLSLNDLSSNKFDSGSFEIVL